MLEDGSIFNELLIKRLNYFIYVVLLMIGLHAMISKRNLIKKLIGMSIFQTAIILFYVSIGVKDGATIPIYKPIHDPHGNHVQHGEANGSAEGFLYRPQALKKGEVQEYANPLPHVLMLTAIVVGVATLGLALALCQRIYQGYGTIEEDELLSKIERADARKSSSPEANSKTSSSTKPAPKKSSLSKASSAMKSSVTPKQSGTKSSNAASPTKKSKDKK